MHAGFFRAIENSKPMTATYVQMDNARNVNFIQSFEKPHVYCLSIGQKSKVLFSFD